MDTDIDINGDKDDQQIILASSRLVAELRKSWELTSGVKEM